MFRLEKLSSITPLLLCGALAFQSLGCKHAVKTEPMSPQTIDLSGKITAIDAKGKPASNSCSCAFAQRVSAGTVKCSNGRTYEKYCWKKKDNGKDCGTVCAADQVTCSGQQFGCS
ncbi:hypothetical protein SAMN05421819_0129 [Bryocella elongata]|uniref:Uncharacterized protein n=1 Tax=Bryocella elongata TaxID=863522 RepID=A0A1H5SA86_9BACT|nr:hypothetical protein SAMN05421819_0129 [Bryocella elongata]